jgi:hypothetical protein
MAGINHWHGSFGDYSGQAAATSMCGGCDYYSFVKGDSDPHKCKCGTTGCAADKLSDNKSVSSCDAFEPRGSGGASRDKENDEKHKGKWGIGAGLGQMAGGAFGRSGGAANMEQIAGGAGKVALGGAALLGKGILGLGKLAAKGISKEIEKAKEAEAQRKAEEEERKRLARAAFRALPLQAEVEINKSEYQEIDITDFSNRLSNEECPAGQKFVLRALFCRIDSEGEIIFQDADNADSTDYLYCKLTLRPPMMLDDTEVIAYITVTDSNEAVCDGIYEVNE